MTPDGGLFLKRRRTEECMRREHSALADVWATPYDAVQDALHQLDVVDEGHIRIPWDPDGMKRALFALKAAGIDVTGMGPAGANAWLRGAVVKEQR